MSKINKALAILAVLAFFLPFITISCNNQQIAHMNGYKLVQCAASSCSSKDIVTIDLKLPGMEAQAQADPSPALEAGNKSGDLNYVLFAAIAVVIAIITLFIPGRVGGLLSGVASVASIALLVIFRSKFLGTVEPHLNSPEAKAAGVMIQIQIQMGMGFWLSIVMSALSAVLAFKGTSATRAPVAPARGPAGGFRPQPPAGASPGSGSQMSVCPSCGAGNTAGNKFCLSCGGSLAAPPPAQPPVTSSASPPPRETSQSTTPAPAPPGKQGSACPSCGASNPSGNKFCLSCGTSLMASVQLFQPTETAAAAPPAPAPAAPVAAATNQQGGDMGWLNAPATMAAAAAASPSGQPLPAVASSREPEPPANSNPVPEVFERQPSLDLRSPQQEPPQPKAAACAACGAPITAQQKFCLSCGTPVGAAAKPPETQLSSAPQALPPEPPQPKQQVCSACSAALSEGQKFCLACGTPVPASASSSSSGTSPATPDLYRVPAETQVFQPPSKSSAKPIIIGIVLVGIFGTAGWFGWKYFAGPDVTVSAFPTKTHVAVGGRTSLQATVSGSKDTDVDWKVEEGAKGGQVNGLGSVMNSGQARAGAIYNAPQNAGVFHVIATSHANSSRSAKIEIVVGGSVQPDTAATAPPVTATLPSNHSAPPTPTPATSTPGTASTAPVSPMAAQITGTWRGPSSGMQTVIGADSTISMTSATDATKNLNGTYHFTDNSHLQIDFGNGDVRTWEIVGVDSNYLRVTSQAKEGSSAIIFAKVQ